jgi:hypothetical protein
MQCSNQIVLRLYATLINLSPTTHGKRKKIGRKKNRGDQASFTTPLRHHQEGYKWLTEEPLMIKILRPDVFSLESFHFVTP